MDQHSATEDWYQDFDILDPRYITDPAHVWNDLRENCPIAFTERHVRSWLPVNYADIAQIAHDTDRFSSRSITMKAGWPESPPSR